MNKSELAVLKFKDGYNCSQSVLVTFAEELQLDRNVALKIANGFGGGMGRTQEVCGAVSGGIMVLGLLFGRGENEGKEKQEFLYSKVQELINEFTKIESTVNCKDLLSGCNLLTESGQKQFKEKLLIDRCYSYVKLVCEIIKKMIGKDL